MNKSTLENFLVNAAPPIVIVALLCLAYFAGVGTERKKHKVKPDEWGQFEKGAAWAFAQVANTNVYLFRDPMELNYGVGVSNITCFFYPRFNFSMMHFMDQGTNSGMTTIQNCHFSSFGPIDHAVNFSNSKGVRSK